MKLIKKIAIVFPLKRDVFLDSYFKKPLIMDVILYLIKFTVKPYMIK